MSGKFVIRREGGELIQNFDYVRVEIEIAEE